ncbi:hypothetical protein EJ06DRAFT_477826 [Trichodelitschia bisporula]|uniref:RING-type E3 ubiquitin transferase n=1 Tax=Trichodelitschia bisporula TaxID=703511 RepID=A0A6G1HVP6_9PEZI|nr:hypothetical protein EJ06DRAFT_477826 [Trichodelitschia bisporula]
MDHDSIDRSKQQLVNVDACVICLQAISDRAVASPCNHVSFDFLCLVSWLQEQPKCPLCKASVDTVQYDWHSPTDFKSFSVPSLKPQAHAPVPRAQHRNNPSSFRSRNPHRQPHHAVPAFVEPDAVLRRRHIYRHKLYSLHVGVNRFSRFRVLTPGLFVSSPELQSRARKWIRRELQIFTFLNPTSSASSEDRSWTLRRANNAEFLLEYIVAVLRTLDIRGSDGRAEDLLQEFLGRENARLFLHELGAWLSSPYQELRDWDMAVQYLEELPISFKDNAMESGV